MGNHDSDLESDDSVHVHWDEKVISPKTRHQPRASAPNVKEEDHVITRILLRIGLAIRKKSGLSGAEMMEIREEANNYFHSLDSWCSNLRKTMTAPPSYEESEASVIELPRDRRPSRSPKHSGASMNVIRAPLNAEPVSYPPNFPASNRRNISMARLMDRIESLEMTQGVQHHNVVFGPEERGEYIVPTFQAKAVSLDARRLQRVFKNFSTIRNQFDGSGSVLAFLNELNLNQEIYQLDEDTFKKMLFASLKNDAYDKIAIYRPLSVREIYNKMFRLYRPNQNTP